MKVLVVLALLAAIAAARPGDQTVSVKQSSSGEYAVNVVLEGMTKTEQRNADGTVSGSYSFVDANGETQRVNYTAGPDGFRATGNSIPVPPVAPSIK